MKDKDIREIIKNALLDNMQVTSIYRLSDYFDEDLSKFLKELDNKLEINRKDKLNMSEAKKKIRKDYFSQNQEAIHHYMWKRNNEAEK